MLYPLPRDLFNKLKRDAVAIDKEVTSDNLFNFVITGYFLIDWIKSDANVPELAVKGLYEDKWLQICRDLAISAKHFIIKKNYSLFSNIITGLW